MSAPNGLLLLDKKSGLSSFDSLTRVKKTFATGKVGHTGTLDRFACGLLVVLVGRAVKLAFLFENLAKEYYGEIFFGAETDTLDPEGSVIAQAPFPSPRAVEAVLGGFRGEILQSPPVYSAIHVNGRRAHELARAGKAPEMKKRPVTIFELEILSWTPPVAKMRFLVSSGTYIRSLARDIALAAGSRGHLLALKRTKVGPFSLEDVEEDVLLPINRALFEKLSIPYFFLDDRAAGGFIHGRPLEALLEPKATETFFAGNPAAERAGVFRKDEPENLLGVLERRQGKWSYAHVFADN